MSQQALTITQKIALVLVALGTERSARVLQHLSPDQVLSIVREMAAVGEIPNQAKRAVLREFRARVSAEEEQAAGLHFAREVLDKALGGEQAQTILRQIESSDVAPPIPYLGSVTPDRAAELLCDEPVHIIVPMLAPLSSQQAAAILERLPDTLRASVSAHMANALPPAPEVRAHLERALRVKATRLHREEHLQGRAALADILRETGMSAVKTEEATAIRAPHPAPGNIACAKTFSYDDLNTLDHATLQAVVRQVSTDDLCQALRGTDHPLREKMIAALPLRRRVVVQNRLRVSQGMSLRALAASQEAITRIADELVQAREAERAYVGDPLYV